MSAEDNKATNRRFYEEVINQKHLAVLDEVAGANYVSHSFPPGLLLVARVSKPLSVPFMLPSLMDTSASIR